LAESSKWINALTSSSSAENKSGKEQLERGNLLLHEKQTHMAVRDEQVINILLPLMHPAPGMQAEMKRDRSYFLPGQNQHLAVWATHTQCCWVCHGRTASLVSSPFRVINNKRQMEVLGFFPFLVGIYNCEKFAIKRGNKAERRHRRPRVA